MISGLYDTGNWMEIFGTIDRWRFPVSIWQTYLELVMMSYIDKLKKLMAIRKYRD